MVRKVSRAKRIEKLLSELKELVEQGVNPFESERFDKIDEQYHKLILEMQGADGDVSKYVERYERIMGRINEKQDYEDFVPESLMRGLTGGDDD